jgi:hypothetical protein
MISYNIVSNVPEQVKKQILDLLHGHRVGYRSAHNAFPMMSTYRLGTGGTASVPMTSASSCLSIRRAATCSSRTGP